MGQSCLKELARRIFSDTLAAIDIPATMRTQLRRVGARIQIGSVQLDLSEHKKILCAAVGKASVSMARGLLDVLGPEWPVEGILVGPEDAIQSIPGFLAIGAGHPLPTQGSLDAGHKMLDFLRRSDDPHTLLFFLLSGGGSAMLELPIVPDLTLSELRQLYQVLIGCGASIEEINAVRKHLSLVKGGKLAIAASNMLKITLGVSDVPSGREAALASGPTLPDPSTISDALKVIERYGIAQQLPPALLRRSSDSYGFEETPKPGDERFGRFHFHLLLSEADLFIHAARTAQAAGCIVECDNSTDDWPVDKAAEYLVNKVRRLRLAHPSQHVALIAGGELSSPVIGNGIGGRNSAFVMECVERIAGQEISVLSAGTDGRDGSSQAAGAVADGDTLARAQALGHDLRDFYLRSDSYTFFHHLQDTIETGPTGNNLRDLRILIGR